MPKRNRAAKNRGKSAAQCLFFNHSESQGHRQIPSFHNIHHHVKELSSPSSHLSHSLAGSNTRVFRTGKVCKQLGSVVPCSPLGPLLDPDLFGDRSRSESMTWSSMRCSCMVHQHDPKRVETPKIKLKHELRVFCAMYWSKSSSQAWKWWWWGWRLDVVAAT